MEEVGIIADSVPGPKKSDQRSQDTSSVDKGKDQTDIPDGKEE